MLDNKRLTRAVARLRSEKPAHWRDELEPITTERNKWNRTEPLKHATMTEVGALCVVLKEVGSLDKAEAEYQERFWRRLALRRRLRLANDDCYGKPANAACRCGGEAIDALTDDELGPLNIMEARARVMKLAKERHKPRPRKPKQPSPPTRAEPHAPIDLAELVPELPAPVQPAPPVEIVSPTHTKPGLRWGESRRESTRQPKWYDDERSIVDRIF